MKVFLSLDITKPKMGSTSHSENHQELPKPSEYMACYSQFVSLMSEQANDCGGQVFARALIDTSKLDKI